MNFSHSDNSLLTGLVHSAVQLADRAVVCDVETEGVRIDVGESFPVYDVTPMFDSREHSPVFIDMANQAIAYGVARGLFELLEGPPMRVRLLHRPPMLFPTI